MKRIRHWVRNSRNKLTAALDLLIAYAQKCPARYRLLFHNARLVCRERGTRKAGAASISEFFGIVAECQVAKNAARIRSQPLAGLRLAAVHGLLALEANGPLSPRKGLKDLFDRMTLMLDLLSGPPS